jgi:hypothetical protein
MAARGSAAGAGTESFSPLAAIRRQFPGWQAWRSDAGRFWATRAGGARSAYPQAEWAETVDGDTPGKLAEALTRQEELAVKPG